MQGKKGKFLKCCSLSLLLIVVALLFILPFGIAEFVSEKMTHILDVPSRVETVTLGINKINFQKIEIENPGKFHLRYAFSADNLSIKAPWTQFLQHAVELEEVVIDHVYLGLEFNSPRDATGNWSQIIDNLEKSSSGPEKKDTKVYIRKLVLNNIRTDLFYQTENKIHHLPLIKEIELTDISTEGGDTFEQIMHSALGQMLKQVFIRQNLKDLFNQLIDPRNTLNNPLSPLKGLFNRKETSSSSPNSSYV